MRITEDICSLSDFVRNTREHVERLRRTRRPEILTRNGHAELVVQSAESYQALLDRLDELETLAALDEAVEEIERGEGRSPDEVIERLKAALENRTGS
jgi:PHD/YefM family antitoxin component YafN of YafNO toxin-antitoxin module